MAELEVVIGGERYPLSCADGDEPRVRKLAELVDDRARALIESGAGGRGIAPARRMLMAALMIADELLELQERSAAEAAAPDVRFDEAGSDKAAADPTQPRSTAAALDAAAERLERLAARLEAEPAPADGLSNARD